MGEAILGFLQALVSPLAKLLTALGIYKAGQNSVEKRALEILNEKKQKQLEIASKPLDPPSTVRSRMRSKSGR